MGNTIGRKVQMLKDKLNNRHNGDTLPEPMGCPNCKIIFAKGTSANEFSEHVDSCAGEQKPFLGYFYQKIPIDNTMIKFKWVKSSLQSFDHNIGSLKPQQVKNKKFQQKAVWFHMNLERMRIPWMMGADIMKIQKQNVFMTTIQQIGKLNLHKQIKIVFRGDEKVNDAGGLLRQWMHMITKQIFSENTGLFMLCDTEDITYRLKNDEELDEQFSVELLMIFGMVIGKALFQKIPMQCYLDKTILRQFSADKCAVLQDIYSYDASTYKSYIYLLNNPIDNLNLQTYFVLNKGKQYQPVQLVQNGQTILVTDTNKKMYIDLCIEQLCTSRVSRSLNAIRKGISKVIPLNFLSIFQPFELQMLLYGTPFISLEDWHSHTEYKGKYTHNHKVIVWFWETLNQYQQHQLAALLKFTTGSSRLPIHGFSKLQTNRGNHSVFIIESAPYTPRNPFPKGHTCFNRLELPEYLSKTQLSYYLKAIVSNDLDGIFGLD